jgi:hypothetical protein
MTFSVRESVVLPHRTETSKGGRAEEAERTW